ncbi:uncharacterized protein LOC111042416 [Myzus persicae]|uniref:uncharacterized protein LOC111042416 n=1 Tax=Myzus persicae TaxID=13164 RepID=UPI000B9359EF|nr:uncharacterized protein LOC111042416 [Myzus persicae]
MQKSNQLYTIVVSDNGQISAVLKQWIICSDDFPVIGHTYQWYCPPSFSFQNIQHYKKVENHWDKVTGTVLNMTDSYITANFLIMTESLKVNKFVIIEFVDEAEVTEVVPCCWIVVDLQSKSFVCQWPGGINVAKYIAYQKPPEDSWEEHKCVLRKFYDTYSEAKKKVSLFCYISTTSEIDTENKKRKRFQKKNFESSSNHEDNEKTKINSKQKLFESNLIDNILDAPRPTIDFDMMGSNDSPDFFALKDDVLHYLNPMSENNCEQLSQNIEHHQFTQMNKDIHLNHQTKTPNICINPVREKDCESLSQNTEYHQLTHHQNQQILSATDNEFIDNDNVNMGKMLMFIGHAVKDVANEIAEIKKSIKEIKLDNVKNQELLILLTDRTKYNATKSEEKVHLFGSNLKVPVSNLDDLHKLESNEEQKKF